MSSIIGKSQRQSRFFVSLLSIGINVLALALPLALLQVYDRILPNQAIGSAFVIFTAVVVALCFSGVLRYVRSGVFARWSAEQEHQLWSETATNLTRGLHSKEEAFLLTGAPTKARLFHVFCRPLPRGLGRITSDHTPGMEPT